MFYDATWRYWVVDRVLGNTQSNQWHMFCLKWFDFEPFACDTWYTSTSGFTMSMDSSYTVPAESTTSTKAPVTTTTKKETTLSDTETTQIVEDKVPDTEIQRDVNAEGAFQVSWMIWTISGCVLCWSFCCVIFYLKKRQKQKKHVDFNKVDNSVNGIYGISDNPDAENINLSMVQMNNFKYGAGTIGSATGTGTKGKGEIIAMNDSDADSSEDDDEVVKHAVVDGTEGDNVTLNDDDDDGQFLEDTDEDNELYGHGQSPTKKGKSGHKKKKSWVKF